MKEAREAVLKSIYGVLNGTIVVDSLTIPYYIDYFGNQEYGIYKQSYRGEADGTKHHFSEMATIEIVCFARGKSEDFVAEMSRRVRGALKASVNSTLTLVGDLQATYTWVNNINCTTEIDDGQTMHRDVISLIVRIDETT